MRALEIFELISNINFRHSRHFKESDMKKEELSAVLNWDRCQECGDCLVNCRYTDFSREEAIQEIKKINKGDASGILKKCISCYACNAFCPNDAHPYERIIYNWNDRYIKEGLPIRAGYLLPGRRPNFREDLPYSPEERALHKKWGSCEPPAKTVLYPGCNLLSMPLLATGRIFDRLPVWGNWDLCCGEMYFRTGIFDKTEETAARLSRFYRDKDIEEMVFICPAGYNMFTTVLPEQFGAIFNFKTTFFTDWLNNEIDKGSFQIKETLNSSAVIHDSCHARILGDEFMEKQRKLLERLGMTVYETPLNKVNGLCCGMAAGANRFSIVDLTKNSLKQLTALDRADGKGIAIYCTGCLLMLSTARMIKPFGKQMFHILEYVRKAMGEKVPRQNMSRALSIVKGIARHSAPYYFSSKRFKFI
jgi:Fe-S oxidoreductase